jgi:hypothetical protein
MRPSAGDRSARALLFGLVGLVGCTFEDGEPWGSADLALTARFEVPESRRTADGALKTANDYAIEDLRLELGLAAFSLAVTEDADAPAGFDPADPPEGFTLCHNGHCHGPGGKLFSYGEVAAAAGGAGTSGSSGVTADVDAPEGVRLETTPTDVPLVGCPCDLGRGRVTAASLALTGLRVRGTVRDLRPESRLSGASVSVDLTVPLDLALNAPLSVRVDRGEPVDVAVEAALTVTPHVLDALDFAQSAVSAELAEQTADTLRIHSRFELEMHR